jgi:hypothetical protein
MKKRTEINQQYFSIKNIWHKVRTGFLTLLLKICLPRCACNRQRALKVQEYVPAAVVVFYTLVHHYAHKH